MRHSPSFAALFPGLLAEAGTGTGPRPAQLGQAAERSLRQEQGLLTHLPPNPHLGQPSSLPRGTAPGPPRASVTRSQGPTEGASPPPEDPVTSGSEEPQPLAVGQEDSAFCCRRWGDQEGVSKGPGTAGTQHTLSYHPCLPEWRWQKTRSVRTCAEPPSAPRNLLLPSSLHSPPGPGFLVGKTAGWRG